MLNEKFEIRELAIVLAAQNHNPTVLNPDFLKYTKIVPDTWELKEPPICIEPMAKVAFNNGISITADLDKVSFIENIENVDEIRIVEISEKYAKELPHVHYTAIGINPKGHIIFDTIDNAKSFIADTFINSGTWSKFENNRIGAGVRFSYKFDQTTFNVSVGVSMWKVSEKELLPVVLFSTNFHHMVIGESKEEKLDSISKIIKDCQVDIDIFKEFIGDLSL